MMHMEDGTEPGWVVLKTKPKCETIAAQSVESKALESYLPVWRAETRPPQRTEPVFPGYVFARVGSVDDLLRIRSAAGISYILPRDAPAAILPDALVEEVRGRLADAEQPDKAAQRDFRSGERVTITHGPFRSVEALFDRRLTSSGRVLLLLELAHSMVKVSVREQDLRRR